MRWQELYTGVCTKRERLLINVHYAVARSSAVKRAAATCIKQLRLSLLPNRAIGYRDVMSSVGCAHSSDEVAVMAMERRGAVIQC